MTQPTYTDPADEIRQALSVVTAVAGLLHEGAGVDRDMVVELDNAVKRIVGVLEDETRPMTAKEFRARVKMLNTTLKMARAAAEALGWSLGTNLNSMAPPMVGASRHNFICCLTGGHSDCTSWVVPGLDEQLMVDRYLDETDPRITSDECRTHRPPCKHAKGGVE